MNNRSFSFRVAASVNPFKTQWLLVNQQGGFLENRAEEIMYVTLSSDLMTEEPLSITLLQGLDICYLRLGVYEIGRGMGQPITATHKQL